MPADVIDLEQVRRRLQERARQPETEEPEEGEAPPPVHPYYAAGEACEL